jgi:hypothetical protein
LVQARTVVSNSLAAISNSSPYSTAVASTNGAEATVGAEHRLAGPDEALR